MSASVNERKASTPSSGVSSVTSSAVSVAWSFRLSPVTDPGPATPPFSRTVNLRKAMCHSVEVAGSAGETGDPPWARLR